MDDIDQLVARAREANEAVHEARDRQAAKVNAALVGKCFKYRNSYSCPEKPSDYWWFYLRIISVKGSELTCHTFQTDCHGKIEVEFKHHKWSMYGGLNDGYQPIKLTEFNKAWRALKKRIAAA